MTSQIQMPILLAKSEVKMQNANCKVEKLNKPNVKGTLVCHRDSELDLAFELCHLSLFRAWTLGLGI